MEDRIWNGELGPRSVLGIRFPRIVSRNCPLGRDKRSDFYVSEARPLFISIFQILVAIFTPLACFASKGGGIIFGYEREGGHMAMSLS